MENYRGRYSGFCPAPGAGRLPFLSLFASRVSSRFNIILSHADIFFAGAAACGGASSVPVVSEVFGSIEIAPGWQRILSPDNMSLSLSAG